MSSSAALGVILEFSWHAFSKTPVPNFTLLVYLLSIQLIDLNKLNYARNMSNWTKEGVVEGIIA